MNRADGLVHRGPGEGGFTLVELVIATGLTLAIAASALALAQRAQGIFQVQVERIDVVQRVRAVSDALARDITRAGSWLPPGTPAFAPYLSPGGEPGLTMRFAAEAGEPATEHSYYVSHAAEANATELRRWNGTADVPVVDHVESAVFTCIDASSASVECGETTRRVRVTFRVNAARSYMRVERNELHVPTHEVVIEAAPRLRAAGG